MISLAECTEHKLILKMYSTDPISSITKYKVQQFILKSTAETLKQYESVFSSLQHMLHVDMLGSWKSDNNSPQCLMNVSWFITCSEYVYNLLACRGHRFMLGTGVKKHY